MKVGTPTHVAPQIEERAWSRASVDNQSSELQDGHAVVSGFRAKKTGSTSADESLAEGLAQRGMRRTSEETPND